MVLLAESTAVPESAVLEAGGVTPLDRVLSAGALEVSALTSATTASAAYTTERVVRKFEDTTGRTQIMTTATTARPINTHFKGVSDKAMPSTNSSGTTPKTRILMINSGSNCFPAFWGCICC